MEKTTLQSIMETSQGLQNSLDVPTCTHTRACTQTHGSGKGQMKNEGGICSRVGLFSGLQWRFCADCFNYIFNDYGFLHCNYTTSEISLLKTNLSQKMFIEA